MDAFDNMLAEVRNKPIEPNTVPYIAFEATMARFERTIKRLVIAVIVAVFLLFATNAAWLYVWMQYDYAGIDMDSEGNGISNYVEAGHNGAIANGADTCSKENKEKSSKSEG